MTSQIMAPGASTSTDQEPVKVSDEATRALAMKMREWSGWPTARLVFGKPTASPFAQCDHVSRTFTANPESLVLNPNRVLLTITPFRLRQEAVLTGALLHEAGHARHSQWQPRSAEQRAAMVHGDGDPVTEQTLALAKLMEEPRIEGIMARESDNIGALGLGWTMRAAAAHLVPTTTLHMTDTGQQVMDLITSWALRAGRQIALSKSTSLYGLPNWVGDFNNLLHTTLLAHLESLGGLGSHTNVAVVIDTLRQMAQAGTTADRGTFMVDKARDILAILFPETDGDDEDAPMPGGCQMEQAEAEESEESESGSEESDSSDTEQAEAEDEAGDPEADSGSDEGESDEGESDEGESDEGESDEGEADEGESDEGESDEGEADEGESDEGEADSEPDSESESPLQQALREIEEQAKDADETEAEGEAEAQPPSGPPSDGAGGGGTGADSVGYRIPTAVERDVQRGAERFLRSLVSPSESSKVVLTESPSATVDGAALAAWKAGGQIRDPHFFKRTKRTVEPTPPVQIAVLVDVSGSMDALQEPSALLSWALSAAAIDLRNFAGRGSQIESCLIHWGTEARVIQHTGDPVPGIKEFDCLEGTAAMHEALALVEEEMPGFFDTPADGHPVNRLLVQFTDWDLNTLAVKPAAAGVAKALEAGVNMLSVVPSHYGGNRFGGNTDLPDILAQCRVQRGTSTVMKYNPLSPGQVWDESSKALA